MKLILKKNITRCFYCVSFFLLFSVQGCSALDAIKAVTGGSKDPLVGIETVVGDKKESVVGQVGSSQDIAVESVSGGITTNNTQEVPIEFMILMVLGWLLPSPNEIWKGLTKFLHGFKGNTSG